MSNESKMCDCNQGRLPCSCKTAQQGNSYTAVGMTTAAAQGFRDGAASVVVELPKEIKTMGGDVFFVSDVRAAIIAAGGSVKDGN